jgi:hypothetical protein
VPGVAWEVKLHKGNARARRPGGHFRNVILFGIDVRSLGGAPHEMIEGSLANPSRYMQFSRNKS